MPRAAARALEADPKLGLYTPGGLPEFQRALSRRRGLICARLDWLAHEFTYVRPEGAYYMFPRSLVQHRNAVQCASALLSHAGVTATPGSAFGPSGKHHLRMAFCGEESVINQAFDRMEALFWT